MKIRCVVEGHGEVAALPILLRRIGSELLGLPHVDVKPPIRQPRQRLIKPGELEKAVELAARQASPDGAVLVLLDADDDCPARLGPALLARARSRCDAIPIAVVLANREYEAWFVAAAASLSGQRGLPATLARPASPEAIRNAKGWLADRMGTYRETIDQPALTASFSLAEAMAAPSFAKLVRDLRTMFSAS